MPEFEEPMVEEVLAAIAAVSEAFDLLQQHRANVGQKVASLRQALDETLQRGQALAERAAALQPLEGPAGEGRADLVKAVTDALEQLDAGLDDCDGVIEGMESRVDAVVVNATDWFDQVNGAVQHELEQLSGVVDDSIQRFEAQLTATGELSTVLAERMDGIREGITTLLESAEGRMEEILEQPATEMLERCRESIAALAQRIVEEAVPAEVENVATELTAAIRQSLDEALAALCQGMDEFAMQVTGCGDRSGETRAVIQPVLDQLRDAIDPVLAELDRIRGLAGSVGISV